MPLKQRTLPQFAASDQGLWFDNEQGDDDAQPLDFTTVVATTWTVTRPDLTVVVWVPTNSQQTTTTMVSTYVFASGGVDLAQPGPYRVAIKHTLTTGGTCIGTGFSFRVVPQDQYEAL
jgi:hypothetical protein